MLALITGQSQLTSRYTVQAALQSLCLDLTVRRSDLPRDAVARHALASAPAVPWHADATLHVSVLHAHFQQVLAMWLPAAPKAAPPSRSDCGYPGPHQAA